ncbi:MAG: helix-turn-helix domain-containing protein [Spongiibacteraceae bacterium]|nr:helix-turn-helix domain-containing protein [Spongiibacteraceae bacterium]
MQTNSPQIPFYDIYGARFLSGEPSFVHIEDIATRGNQLGWKIKPHRHNRLFQVLCVIDGELQLRINNEDHSLQGSWIATLPVGVVHGFQFQPNTQGFVLSMTDSLLSDNMQPTDTEQHRELFQSPQLFQMPEDNSDFHPFLTYIRMIRSELANFHTNQNQALSHLARLVLLTLNRQLQHNWLQALPANNKDSLLLNRFRTLIEEHYLDRWAVSTYAEALHTSTSTLNRLCNHLLGENPKHLIQDRLLTEAKRKLMYTQLSLEEIAYTLGFKDYPYFSRFFKRLEGTTAGAWRKQVDQSRSS